MEGPFYDAPLVTYLSELIPEMPFTVVDIGCSGGIHPVWLQLGKRLRAIGVDPNIAEIERLREAWKDYKGVEHVAAFAGLPPDHPFRKQKGTAADWQDNPMHRMATFWALDLLQQRELTTNEKTEANLWQSTQLTDVAETIYMPDYFDRTGVTDVDFVKIDVDGKDLEVLISFEPSMDQLGILGFGLEVTFFGTDSPTDNTFHNTDRFMKSKGYDLYNLTSMRRYALRALPSKFVYKSPSEGDFGRLLQADALFLRDLSNAKQRDLMAAWGAPKLLNAMCLYALYSLPDAAADIAVTFRDLLKSHCDVDHALDLLTQQAQSGMDTSYTYKQWLERFAAQDRMFYVDPQ